MTKTELEAKIEALQSAFDVKVQEQNAYRGQIDALKKELADLNKPRLTMKQFDELTELVEQGVDSFDFDDQDSYDIDFDIDYDNKIQISCMSFQNSHELCEAICKHVYGMFGEADEDNNQLNQD